MSALEQALQELARVPLAEFTARRNRLADELRAAGDKDAAKVLAARRRPSASVWAVNQLYWHERPAFDALLALAERVRRGDAEARRAYPTALADLRRRAAALLEAAGQPASELTLRRLGATLAALAAAGGFDPDPPGALAADRDPPGFEAIGIAPDDAEPARPPSARPAASRGGGAHDRARKTPAQSPADRAAAQRAARQAALEEARARRAAEREQQRRAAERARREAARRRIEAALQKATETLADHERTRAALEERRRAVEQAITETRTSIAALEKQLAELPAGDD